MSEREYFYAIGSEQRGPIIQSQLIAMNLPPATLVWREGLENWQTLDSLPELVAQAPNANPPRSSFPPSPSPYPQAQAAPYPPPIGYSTLPPRDGSKRILAGVFGILLGAFGIHKFIIGYTGAGLIMCLVTIFTCGYAGLIFGPIGLAEGIIYLCTSDEDFYQRYVVGKRSWF